MPDIVILNLPKTRDEAILRRISTPLRRLRLMSLRTDAACFKSRYSEEVNQPRDFWINRLRDDVADHWLAFDTNLHDDLTPFEVETGGRLIAFLVVLSLGTRPFPKPQCLGVVKHDCIEDCETFLFGAVYVDPIGRGRRVSTTLMNAAADKLRSQWQPRAQRVVITLEVRTTNKSAIQVYENLGFQKYGESVEESDGRDGIVCDLMKLEMIPGNP